MLKITAMSWMYSSLTIVCYNVVLLKLFFIFFLLNFYFKMIYYITHYFLFLALKCKKRTY